jgi:hypothetical protein
MRATDPALADPRHVDIIGAVKTPIAFFTLIVLVFETVFGIAAAD